MIFGGRSIDIFLGQIPVYAKSYGQFKKGQMIHKRFLSDILVAMANFKKPTELINELLSELQRHLGDSNE